MTLVFAAIAILGAAGAGTLAGAASDATLDTWGAGVDSTVTNGQWWTIASALVVPSHPVKLIVAVVVALTGLGWAERRLGPARTAITLAGSGVTGLGIGLLAQGIGNAIGESWSAETFSDSTLDPLIPMIGTILAASAFAGPLWRRRIRIGGFAVLIVLALYNGGSPDAYRLFAGVSGLVFGVAMQSGKARFALHRSSHSETRNLLALSTAISAVGPIIAALNPNGIGVLSLFGWIFGDPFPDAEGVQRSCASESALSCAHDSAFLQLRGPGSLLLLFVPLVLLLIAAYGLRRGRRLGIVLAIAVNLVLFALACVFSALVVIAVIQQQGSDGMRPIDAVELAIWAAGPVLVPLALSTVLLINRAHFRIGSAPGRVARFWRRTSLVFGVLALGTFVTSLATIASFAPSVESSQLLVDAALRFLPANFFLSNDAVYFSTNPATAFLLQWVGPAFWAFVAVELLRALSSFDSVATRAGESEIRELIRRGGGTLASMAVWPGNSYWFSADRRSAVAYRVVGGVAITLSDPLCREGTERETILGFLAHCDDNGWIPALYSVHEEYLPIVEELGWESLPVAVETTMDLSTLSFEGKAWQNIRTPLNRGLKEGISAEWTDWAALPRTLHAQIWAISERWATEKGLPEMGFTLGGYDELRDREVRLMLAIDRGCRIQALTSWLPIYRDGETVGWTLDVMRKAPGSMPGIMEFLIASAALRMRESGHEILSLSGVPLATPPQEEGTAGTEPTTLTRLLDLLARKLEPAYGFSSLFTYKAKFHPRYETLSLAYRDPLTLPAIGRAIGGAYLPNLSGAEKVALARILLSA